jgi:hypothetical protein
MELLAKKASLSVESMRAVVTKFNAQESGINKTSAMFDQLVRIEQMKQFAKEAEAQGRAEEYRETSRKAMEKHNKLFPEKAIDIDQVLPAYVAGNDSRVMALVGEDNFESFMQLMGNLNKDGEDFKAASLEQRIGSSGETSRVSMQFDGAMTALRSSGLLNPEDDQKELFEAAGVNSLQEWQGLTASQQSAAREKKRERDITNFDEAAEAFAPGLLLERGVFNISKEFLVGMGYTEEQSDLVMNYVPEDLKSGRVNSMRRLADSASGLALGLVGATEAGDITADQLSGIFQMLPDAFSTLHDNGLELHYGDLYSNKDTSAFKLNVPIQVNTMRDDAIVEFDITDPLDWQRMYVRMATIKRSRGGGALKKVVESRLPLDLSAVSN